MFLDVKTATERTGKSQSTINTLCKKNANTKHVKHENNKYFIESSFLFTVYPERAITSPPPEPEHETTSNTSETTSNTSDITSNYINLIENQLNEKDKTISELLERIKEQNYIIQSLQQKALPEVKTSSNAWLNFLKSFGLIQNTK